MAHGGVSERGGRYGILLIDFLQLSAMSRKAHEGNQNGQHFFWGPPAVPPSQI